MTHASLFSGIGGFDLAAERAGFTNIFQVENDPWCLKILQKNFPSVARYGDITHFNGKPYANQIDVLTGGFPCQPFSIVGKRKGKADNRYLWPQMFRVIREIRPKVVIGENVPGIINMALNQVLTDLESIGYITETFVIPACAKNAPHRRDRVWIIAYTKAFQDECLRNSTATQAQSKSGDAKDVVLPDAGSIRRSQFFTSTFPGKAQRYRRRTTADWDYWKNKPRMGRVADGVPHRVDRIKGLGNAVVPCIPESILHFVILKYHGNVK